MSMKNKAIYALYSNAVSIGGDAEIVLDGNDIDITKTYKTLDDVKWPIKPS